MALRVIIHHKVIRTNKGMKFAKHIYIDASLDEINKKYGSVEGYAQKRLGMSEEEIQKLRNQLLRVRQLSCFTTKAL
jgi:protein tyrosine/serine phosphatase